MATPKENPDNNLEIMLTRIDERTNHQVKEIETLKEYIKELKLEIADLKKDGDKYVTKEQFDPIQKAVISVISFVVMSVIAAMVGLVIVKPPVP